MKYVVIVLAGLLAGAASSCFRPQLSCGRCGAGNTCPIGLSCRKDGLCVSDPGEQCRSPLTMGDASTDMATGGTGTGTGGGGGMAGTDPGFAAGGGPGGAAGSRPVACTDHCCIGAECFSFPPTLQQGGLLFWGDRTSMGTPGYVLSSWRDRSTYANDIVPLATNASTPPRVQLYEGGEVVRIDQPGMVIASKDATATAFGTDDFTILVLARCDVDVPRSCVFRQAKMGDRPLMSVALYCNSAGESILSPPYMYTHAELRVTDDNVSQGYAATVVSSRTDLNSGMHLFGARRVGRTKLQLRVDGRPEVDTPIPETLALDYQAPLYVGSCAPTMALPPPYVTTFKGELGAAVVVHGNLSDDEVASLEKFLLDTRAAAP